MAYTTKAGLEKSVRSAFPQEQENLLKSIATAYGFVYTHHAWASNQPQMKAVTKQCLDALLKPNSGVLLSTVLLDPIFYKLSRLRKLLTTKKGIERGGPRKCKGLGVLPFEQMRCCSKGVAPQPDE